MPISGSLNLIMLLLPLRRHSANSSLHPLVEPGNDIALDATLRAMIVISC